ncbi:MAG: InlB B-repeat-containing protein, partial [Kiritimatiellae bacterium]|nr:InlB B-repeat-containing protein [Kiritimatiellia bacterium]
SGGLSTSFMMAVCLADVSGADDVSTLPALEGATYKAATKTLLTGSASSQYGVDTGFANYEGMCLGPRNSDGTTTLMFIADGGGNSFVEKSAMSKKLSGLSVRTVSFAGDGAAEPVGGPYRYVDGATVSFSQPAVAGSPYEAETVMHYSWSAPAHSVSGNGASGSFTVSADDTVTWTYAADSTKSLLAADSFERTSAGAEVAAAVPGWSGDGTIAETSYSVSVERPLPLETHELGLFVDGDVERDCTGLGADGKKVDLMMSVQRERADSGLPDVSGGQVALYFDVAGRPVLVHASADGASELRTPVSSATYADGDWVRVTLSFDYDTDPSAAWCRVQIDGQDCPTAAGVASPAGRTAPGPWYRAFAAAVPGKIGTVAFNGTGKVDDFALYSAIEALYTVSFDSAGGSAVAPVTSPAGAAVPAPADPTKEGSVFAGWVPAVPATMPAENLVCTAQWLVLVAAPEIAGKTYTGAAQAADVPASAAYTVQSNAGGSAAGAYDVVLSLAPGYAWADTAAAGDKTLVFTISKAPLLATARDVSVVEGTPASEVAYPVEYSGFVGSDTESALSAPAAATSAYTASAAYGSTFAITVSGGSAANYELSYASGTLVVKRGPVEAPEAAETSVSSDGLVTVVVQDTRGGARYAAVLAAPASIGGETVPAGTE